MHEYISDVHQCISGAYRQFLQSNSDSVTLFESTVGLYMYVCM